MLKVSMVFEMWPFRRYALLTISCNFVGGQISEVLKYFDVAVR